MVPSIRKNIAFNYGGQLYSSLIGILVLPLFLKYVGAEAYGLIGFYTLIQAWMNLLDMGMSPTLGREVARLKDRPPEHWRLVSVVNTLEFLFLVFAVCLGMSIFISRNWISTEWLNVESLPVETVSTCVGIIAITVATRWVSSINRSGINAYEAQVWMNIVEVIVNTFRFPVALLIVVWTDGNVLAYFYFQLVVVIIEITAIRLKLRTLMPDRPEGAKWFSTKELKRVAPFALSIGYTGAIWVLLTQLDKLILSKILTLSDYGYFTLVATIASGIVLLAAPVSKAVLPRMTALLAAGETKKMLDIYRRSTRVVVAFVAPVTLVISLMPEMVIYTWTGDRAAADWTRSLLPLFVLGSGLLVIVAFQYYIQYAHGVLKYHVAYNTASVIINLPLIVFAAFEYGAIGVAWVWFGFRFVSFLLWVPFVHHKFFPTLHMRWLLLDVMPGIVMASIAVLAGMAILDLSLEMSRLQLFFSFLGLTMAVVILVSLSTLTFRLRHLNYRRSE